MKPSILRLARQIRLTALSATVMVCVAESSTATAADDLAAAEATVKKAAAEEGVAYTEWNSREMARSATREIARSDRQRADDTLRNVQAAQQNRKQRTADANTKASAADVAAAQKDADEKLATFRQAAERLIADSLTADRAVQELFVVENLLCGKAAATRAAEGAVLGLKCQAAAKAKSADLEAARRAVCESQALAAWEIQQWADVQRSTAHQLVEQTSGAARIATAAIAAETSSDWKMRLHEFAQNQTNTKTVAEKLIAQRTREIDAAVAVIYPLRATAMGGLAPLSPQAWNRDKARHLLVRAGFGGTPAEVNALCAMGPHKAVDHLVDFHHRPAADVPFDATPPLPADALEGKLRGDFVRGQVAGARAGVERAQMARLRLWWLRRMVESPRPLQEKLTLFWHGHFATQDSVVQNSYSLYRQNQLLREQAAGNFGALLYGIVHDPAMLRYLDNNRNVKGQPNENLAREIMELFSMGVDQGYTEKDIIHGARALTGYTLDGGGVFRFIESQHDKTDKTVFGKTGPWTGDDLVQFILAQPATSRFVARKLFAFFAHREPSDNAVDQLASVLRANQYEIGPTLKNLFLSEEFYSARSVGTQIKCPVQLTVGALRDLGIAQLTSYDALDAALREMGQELFEPPDVKGWRYGREWINTSRLLIRYNATADLVRAAPQRQRQGIDVVALVASSAAKSPAEIVDHLVKTCLAKPLPAEKRQKLIELLTGLPPHTAGPAHTKS
jgi:uncharacterized protein (DUF1800 family)